MPLNPRLVEATSTRKQDHRSVYQINRSTKDQALASLQLFATSTVIPFGSSIVTWRVDKGGEYTGEDFKAYCQESDITQ